ncbi:uncharacterized protein N7483_008111 [Penicillium malachiteum]|uniref:uncharacterized protein n=1 Tax=Penicillium malachiteum TaxID=1324776 RepID=UPI002547EB4D|nr:uncharacterized protein N7483_008111 [Penicillium malachiteum]KAJ5726754.1 hypothetical protein N7483_008111 [Penicillium malachiteum]
MQFIVALAAFAGVALAQSTSIALPKAGDTVAAGSDLVVQIQRPDTLTGSDEIVVAIGMVSCPGETTCPSAGEALGNLLYHGSFDPDFGTGSYYPYENFTITVPSSFAAGNAQVNVAHLSTYGASGETLYETYDQTVVIS